MADSPSSHGTADHGHAHGPTTQAFLMVFGVLCICTLVSFIANTAARNEIISVHMSFTIILAVAILKATLVGMIFMHLKWDWGKVFIMIVPALVLGPLLVIVLMPDIVLAWHSTTP